MNTHFTTYGTRYISSDDPNKVIENVDLSILAYVALVIFFLLVSKLIFTKLSKVSQANKKIMEERMKVLDLENTLKNRKDAVISKFDRIVVDLHDTRNDPAFLIDYPNFCDVTKSYIVDLDTKMSEASASVNVLRESEMIGISEEAVSASENKVSDFEYALIHAKEEAISEGWGVISAKEKSLLSRTRELLNMVSDQALSEHERENALRALRSSLRKLKEDHNRSFINEGVIYKALESRHGYQLLTEAPVVA